MCIKCMRFYLQSITTDIALKKPGDPIEFMIEEIEKLQEMDRRKKGVILKKSPASKNSNIPNQDLSSENLDKKSEES